MILDLVLALSVVILLLITVIGIGWAIVRERHMVNMHNQQTHAIVDIEKTIAEGTEAIRAGFESLQKKIERSDDISDDKRQEIVRLIVDVERRLMDTMRDNLARIQQGMQVNFNQDVDRANVNTGSGRQHNG